MNTRSENTISPGCQCCQPGITFKFFKWHYVVSMNIWHPLMTINNLRKARFAVLQTMDTTKIFAMLYKLHNFLENFIHSLQHCDVCFTYVVYHH